LPLVAPISYIVRTIIRFLRTRSEGFSLSHDFAIFFVRMHATDGRNGSIWYNELAVNLTDDLGYDGDYYMFTNGTVYYKMNGTWGYFTSLMGLTGPQGETGPQGPQGETGETGPQGPAETDGINGTDGLNGQDGATGATVSAGVDASVPWWLYVVAAGCVGASCYSVYKSRKKKPFEKMFSFNSF